MGQPGPRPFSFKTLGLLWPAMGIGLGPKVPTMPPFSYRGGKPSSVGRKRKCDRRNMGNDLLLMQLNSRCEFYNFYATALDVTRPLGLILRYRNGYKKGRVMKFVILLVTQVFMVEKVIRLMMKTLW